MDIEFIWYMICNLIVTVVYVYHNFRNTKICTGEFIWTTLLFIFSGVVISIFHLVTKAYKSAYDKLDNWRFK